MVKELRGRSENRPSVSLHIEAFKKERVYIDTLKMGEQI